MARILGWTRSHRTVTCAVAVTGVLVLGACGSSGSGGSTGSSGEITIGAAWALTGANAALGAGFERGANAAVAYVNSQGGINGRTLKLVTQDTHSTPVGAAAAAKALAGNPDVVAMVGDELSGDVLAEAPVVESAKLPLFTNASTDSIYDTKTYHYTFLAADTNTHRAIFDTQYLAKTLGKQRIGILSEVGAYGNNGSQQSADALKALGLQPAAKISFPAGATDLSAQVKQLKDAGIDGLIAWTFGPPLIAAMTGMNNLGLHVPVVAPGITSNLSGVPADTLNNVYGGPSSKYILRPPGGAVPQQGQEFITALKSYVDSTKTDPASVDVDYASVGYSDVATAVAAMKIAGTISRDGIKSAAESGKPLEAVGMIHTYSPTNHTGFREEDFGLFEFINGTACTLTGCNGQ